MLLGSLLLLSCCLLAGIVSTTAHRASLRLRRGNAVRYDPSSFLRRARRTTSSELPPLPLEFEEEEDMYMSIDDPRVGSVDEHGNVLIPVDDEGRVLPGFEHLLLVPPRVEEDPVATATEETVIAPEPDGPSRSNHEDAERSVGAELSDDESTTEQAVSSLPVTGDYVDSNEIVVVDGRRQSSRPFIPKPNLTELESVFKKAEEEGPEVEDSNFRTSGPGRAAEDISEAGNVERIVNDTLLGIQEEMKRQQEDEEESENEPLSKAHTVRVVDKRLDEPEVFDFKDVRQASTSGEEGWSELLDDASETVKHLPIGNEEATLDDTKSLRRSEVLQHDTTKSGPNTYSDFLPLIVCALTVTANLL